MIIIIIIIYVCICENGVRENFTPHGFQPRFRSKRFVPAKKTISAFFFIHSLVLLNILFSFSFPSLKVGDFQIVKFRSLAHLVQKNEIFINTVFIGLLMYELRPNHNGLLCLKVLCIVLIFLTRP